MPEFPAVLYRYGSQIHWDGERFDRHVVHDEKQLAKALENGWHLGKPPKQQEAEHSPEPPTPASGAESPAASPSRRGRREVAR